MVKGIYTQRLRPRSTIYFILFMVLGTLSYLIAVPDDSALDSSDPSDFAD